MKLSIGAIELSGRAVTRCGASGKRIIARQQSDLPRPVRSVTSIAGSVTPVRCSVAAPVHSVSLSESSPALPEGLMTHLESLVTPAPGSFTAPGRTGASIQGAAYIVLQIKRRPYDLGAHFGVVFR